MDEQKRILKLAAQIATMDLEGLQESYSRKLFILDSQIQAFRELEKEYRQRLADMEEAITNLKALYQINMRVLNIVNSPEKAGGNNNASDFTRRFTQ